MRAGDQPARESQPKTPRLSPIRTAPCVPAISRHGSLNLSFASVNNLTAWCVPAISRHGSLNAGDEAAKMSQQVVRAGDQPARESQHG